MEQRKRKREQPDASVLSSTSSSVSYNSLISVGTPKITTATDSSSSSSIPTAHHRPSIAIAVATSVLPLDQLVTLVITEAQTLQNLTKRNWSQHGRTPIFSRIAKVVKLTARVDKSFANNFDGLSQEMNKSTKRLSKGVAVAQASELRDFVEAAFVLLRTLAEIARISSRCERELCNNLESKVFVPLTTFAFAAISHIHRLCVDAMDSMLPTFMNIAQSLKQASGEGSAFLFARSETLSNMILFACALQDEIGTIKQSIGGAPFSNSDRSEGACNRCHLEHESILSISYDC